MKKQKSGLYEKSLIRIILFLCINFIHFPLYGYYFKNIGVKDGLSQPSILSIHQDELGRMWFGTLQGLSIYDGNEMITLKGGEERFDNYIKNNTIYRIVEDSNHNIFLRADNSLVCYKLTEERALELYDRYAKQALELMLAKNHDYDEAWQIGRAHV